jgi:hypothetical protein
MLAVDKGKDVPIKMEQQKIGVEKAVVHQHGTE